MRGLSRYIITQIAGPFAVATLILTGIIWLTQALRLLDVVVMQGQSAGTYFVLTMLAMPSVITIILPIAFFFAVLYALHRLYSDSELVVMFSAGISRWGIARPVIFISLAVSLLLMSLSMFLSPAGLREVATRVQEIRTDVITAVIREGQFNNPSQGLTVYVREQGAGGTIQGILVHDNRDPMQPVTYMAENGQLLKSDAGPRLLMFNGNIQRTIKTDEGPSITLLYFDKYTYDLAYLAGDPEDVYYEASERFFHELLWPAEDDIYGQKYYPELFAEAHQRLSTLLHPLMFAAIALASLISAEFNRRGYTVRIIGAVTVAILVRILCLGIQNLTVKTPLLAIALYAVPIAVILICLAMILRPDLFRKAGEKLRFYRRPVTAEV